MSQMNDAQYAAVNTLNRSLFDEYYDWLLLNGGSGSSVPDAESSMLVSKGVIAGPIPDMWLDHLTTLAVPGNSLQDKKLAFWVAGG